MTKKSVPPFVDFEVVAYRFSKAFPETSKCIRWLNPRYEAGAAWQPLLDSYVVQINEGRARRLFDEIADLKEMGVADESDMFAVLICDVLGLDRDILIAESETPAGFMIGLQERLLALQATNL